MAAPAFSPLHLDLPVCIGYGAASSRAEMRHCLLPARAESVSEARRFVRDVAAGWSPRASRMDVVLADLSVVVSELVTNALVHAYSAVASRRGGEAGPITLCLIHEPCESGMERVVFAVTDPSVESPLSPGLEDVGGDVCELWESGRGMTLVEALADDWGWRRVRSRDGMAPAGKIVWALFELAC